MACSGGRLEFNREHWRFSSPERAAVYRMWVSHLRATGRNTPLSAARGPFPHGVSERLAGATRRLPGDDAIPRDTFNWLFDGFDDRTNGMALPEQQLHPGFAPAELVPYLPARKEAAAEGPGERLTAQAALVQRPQGFEDALGLMPGLLVLPLPFELISTETLLFFLQKLAKAVNLC